MTLIFHLSNHA